MRQNRKYEEACSFLKDNNLRFSRQRMAVIQELFFNNNEKKHFKISEILDSIKKDNKNINISSASLTNILKGLCKSGVLKEIHANKPYYDINTNPHIHVYDEKNDELFDFSENIIVRCIKGTIDLPEDYDINCVLSVKK